MAPRKHLQKFWIQFERMEGLSFLNLGCGVTGHSREDAIDLAQRCLADLSPGSDLPKVLRVVEDIKFDELEQGHVAPNIGDMSIRGVWYPTGCSNPMSQR